MADKVARVARYCSICWRFLDYEGHGAGPIEWVDCGVCAGGSAVMKRSQSPRFQPIGNGSCSVLAFFWRVMQATSRADSTKCLQSVMERTGIEPVTSGLQSRRSPS
jgi:hypothetical protein